MDYKLGDVLIFEAEDSFLSRCIAKITNSNVSHSAMVYDESKMVEMGGNGIYANRFLEDENGEVVHIMRLKQEHPFPPLFSAANYYLDKRAKYDYPSLLILAGLLIYWPVRPTVRWQHIADSIIKAACLKLDKILNKIIHGDDTVVMMCSQLVYQCYLDCGKDYFIKINKGILQTAPVTDGSIRLIDSFSNYDGLATDWKQLESNFGDEEEMAKELLESLVEGEELPKDELIGVDCLQSTGSLVVTFLDLLEEILAAASINLPMESLFVTPADLYLHTENLEEVGVMKIKRIVDK